MSVAERLRGQNRERAARRREEERNCAGDFNARGTDGHVDRCVFVRRAVQQRVERMEPREVRPKHWIPKAPERALACEKVYRRGEAPDDELLYRGTGIGLLYGIYDDKKTDNYKRLAATLRGWSVKRGDS